MENTMENIIIKHYTPHVKVKDSIPKIMEDVGGFQRSFTAEQTFDIVGGGLRFDEVDDLMHFVV